MKSRNRRPVLHIVLTIVALAVTFSFGQTSAPPIKMGLWEITVHNNTTGYTIPPEVLARLKAAGRPVPNMNNTLVRQSCMTVEQWRRSMTDLNNQDPNCKRTNVVENSHQISFDMACSSNDQKATGHAEWIFENPERMRGTIVMAITRPASQDIHVNTNLGGHFISTSCGDIRPGGDKTVVAPN